MNNKRSDFLKLNNTKTGPNAESTIMEDGNKSTRFSWGGKTPKRKFNTSPLGGMKNIQQSSILSNSSFAAKGNSQVFLDAQSNGLASRIVMYSEQSVKKQKPLSNQTYSRSGDYPLVHLNKTKLTYKPHRNLIHSTSKVKIAAPVKSTYETSARSEIFRSGHNKPTDIAFGTPLLPSTHLLDDSDTQGTRSVLDALKEISRKRIHCNDPNTDHSKKHKDCPDGSDANQLTKAANMGASTKRQWDGKVSPTNSNLSIDGQQKRIKNNDILSSLSSSAHQSTTPKPQINHTIQSKPRENVIIQPAQKKQTQENEMCNTKTTIGNENVKKQQANETITLFNKRFDGKKSYKPATSACAYDSDDESQSISFIKPKDELPIETIPDKGGLKSSQKSKLQLMMSWLSGNLNDADNPDDMNPNAQKTDKESNNVSNPIMDKTNIQNSNTDTLKPIQSTFDVILSSASVASTSMTVPQQLDTTKKTESFGIKPVNITTASTLIPDKSMVYHAVTTAPSSTSFDKLPPLYSTIASIPFVPSIIPSATSTAPALTSTISPISQTNSIPRLGGFCFAATSTTNSAAKESDPIKLASIANDTKAISNMASTTSSFQPTTTKRTDDVQKTGFSFGTSVSFGSSGTATNSTTVNAFTTTTTTTSTPSLWDTTKAPTAFAFGNTQNVTAVASKQSSPLAGSLSGSSYAPVTSTSTASFTFGNVQNTNTSNPAPYSFNQTAAKVQETVATITTTTTTTSLSIAPQSNMGQFSFGGFSSGASAVKIVPTSIVSTLSQNKSQSNEMGANQLFKSGNEGNVQPITNMFGQHAMKPSAFAGFEKTDEPKSQIRTTTATGSIFGQTTNTSPPSYFSSSNANTDKNIFGTQSNNVPATVPSSMGTSNIFGGGGGTSIDSSKSNVFNQASVPSALPPPPAFPETSLFGNGDKLAADKTAKAAFQFGANATSSNIGNAQQSATNMFTQQNQQTNVAQPKMDFSFPSSSQNNGLTPVATTPATTNLSPSANIFSLGESNQQQKSMNSTFFANPTTTIANNNSFNFGSSLTATAAPTTNTGFNFGSTISNTISSFNFSSHTPQQQQQQQQPFTMSTTTTQTPTMNLFSPDPASSSSTKRPIRQATRRLK